MPPKTSVETAALLVKKDQLQGFLEGVLANEKEIVKDLETIIPHVKSESLADSLKRRLKQGQDCLVALEAGFVPVATGYFANVETKAKWQKRLVDETLESMPSEVREVWDKVKDMGVFDQFAVTVRGGGDPILVGKKGKRYFFIAGWLPISQGLSLGIRVKLP